MIFLFAINIMLRWSFNKKKDVKNPKLRTSVPIAIGIVLRNLKKHLQLFRLCLYFALFLKLLKVITKGGGKDPMKP